MLFANSNVIHIKGYGVQAGPNNAQREKGTESFREEAMVQEHIVPHTHLQKEGLSMKIFFVWQVTVLEVTADNQPKATVLTSFSFMK